MQSAMRLFGAFLCLLLSACGGGGNLDQGTDNGNGSNPSGTTSVTLTISNSTISAATPATLTATVRNSVSGAISGALVTFELNNADLGTFVPAIGTALTDANGVATVSLATSNIAGAGQVTASLSSGQSNSVGFTMVGDGGPATGGGAQMTLTLTDANGDEVSTIDSTSPGTLTAHVSGISRAVIVTFAADIGDLPVKTAVTDANGAASVTIYAGSNPGAGTATATIATGESAERVFVVGATDILMGSGTPFTAEQASVSAATISAGGTATVSVQLQDADGNLFTEPVEVRFSSRCAAQSSPRARMSSPVTAVNGVASSTYLAQGCVGSDPISVTANVGGRTLSATGSIEVLAAAAGSIVFLDASPTQIDILGTGVQETSVVRFQVLDTNGNPVAGRNVSFSLNTSVGGLSVAPTTATTDDQGVAQTVVNSGTVATSIRVTATVDGSVPLITSQSSQLVISTGIPDQDSFSLSAVILNAEGWNVDGTQVVVTARLADAFNNPVRNGTAVSFVTEGGAIGASCVTVNGACSVTWTSQNVRPAGQSLLNNDGTYRNPRAELVNGGNFYGQPFGGRATITAYAIGEESFPDLNGNGRFDESERTAFAATDVSGQPYDLADAFRDYNEDGIFNPQQAGGQSGGDNEVLIDFNSNGVFDTADGVYNGVLCAIPSHAGCADGVNQSKSVYVRGSLVMVMASSEAYATNPSDIRIIDRDGDNLGGSIDINGNGTATVQFTIADVHNQQMPAGSVVSFATSAGSIDSAPSYTWPSSNYNGGRQFSVTIGGADQPDSGTFSVTVTSPNGLVTEVVNIAVNIY
ncbi:hypothetical protein L9G15_10030 [Shewanella sp. A3A]|nr:hypothetical protein [Shewanella ferrihydritica]